MADNNRTTRWKSGWMVQGIYLQWLYRNHPDADSVISLLRTVVDNTLAHRKRYAYIKADNFRISHNTIPKHASKAIALGLLETKRTHGYTMYKLILPDEIERNTVWLGGKDTTGQTSTDGQAQVVLDDESTSEGWGKDNDEGMTGEELEEFKRNLGKPNE